MNVPIASNAMSQSVVDEQPPPGSDVAPRHDGGAGDPLCAQCGDPFKPAPRHEGRQKFGDVACRNAWHEARRGHGIACRVSSVRALKGGRISITVRVDAEERDRAVQLEPGKLVEVL
jgi:hypothetical protein